MSKQLKADFLLIIITVIWGASFSLMKNVLLYIPGFAYLSIRFIIAALVLTFIFRKKLKLIKKETFIFGGIIGLIMFGMMGLQVSGLYFTSASNSAFITGLNVVMVPVVSAIMLKKKPDLSSTVGVLLAFVGLFFLTGGLNFKFNFGDLLTFICAVFCTFHIISIDKFTNEEDPALLAIFQIGFAAVLSCGLWITVDGGKPIVFNLTVVVTLLITGLLGTALAFAGQTIVQKDTSPTHTALIFTAEPVFGALFAMVIPNASGKTESLPLLTGIGCLLILVGMLISEFKLSFKKRIKTVD